MKCQGYLTASNGNVIRKIRRRLWHLDVMEERLSSRQDVINLAAICVSASATALSLVGDISNHVSSIRRHCRYVAVLWPGDRRL